tara:strand:+ start:87 stop:680 length:594 start_codon:yes stop_codon:yes gene_type:complete
MAVRPRPRQAEMDTLQISEVEMTDVSAPPEAVEARVEAADTMGLETSFDNAMRQAAPEGNYTPTGLNALGQTINQALKLFGEEARPIDPYTDAESVLPLDIVKAVAMLNQAASDAGLDRFVIDLGTLTDDRALQEAAGKVDALAQNETFRMFLSQMNPIMSTEDELEDEMMAQQEIPEMDMGEEVIDEEELFMRRMR